MPWLRTHPFALLFAGAGLLLLAIIIFVNGTTIPSSSFDGSVVAIPGGNTLQDPGISAPYAYTPSQTEGAYLISDATTSASIPLPIPGSPAPAPTHPDQEAASTETDAAYDLSALQSTQTNLAGPDTSAGDSIIQQVYALIPSTFSLPIYTPSARTPAQQALYAYGNQAGLVVLTFENNHADMADVLKTWMEGRSSASATARAKQIAIDMSATGDALLMLSNVPASALATHQSLAHGYQNAGKELLRVLEGGSDSRLVDSMKTYNAVADDFTRSYIALVDLFSQNSVMFSSTDMGSAFQFQGSSF